MYREDKDKPWIPDEHIRGYILGRTLGNGSISFKDIRVITVEMNEDGEWFYDPKDLE